MCLVEVNELSFPAQILCLGFLTDRLLDLVNFWISYSDETSHSSPFSSPSVCYFPLPSPLPPFSLPSLPSLTIFRPPMKSWANFGPQDSDWLWRDVKESVWHASCAWPQSLGTKRGILSLGQSHQECWAVGGQRRVVSVTICCFGGFGIDGSGRYRKAG